MMSNDQGDTSVDDSSVETGGRSARRGWWVNPPGEMKKLIEERCKESLRDPQQEIVWILRDWYRKVHEPTVAKTDRPKTDSGVVDPGDPQ